MSKGGVADKVTKNHLMKITADQITQWHTEVKLGTIVLMTVSVV
jgi:hypothetical protein